MIDALKVREKRQHIFNLQQTIALVQQSQGLLHVVRAADRMFRNAQPEFSLQRRIRGPCGRFLGEFRIEGERQLDGLVPQTEQALQEHAGRPCVVLEAQPDWVWEVFERW